MAERGELHGFETWTIRSVTGQASATFVPALGGIGSSLVLHGPEGPRELLYTHDWFWDRDTRETRGGWPLLFPVCGRLERGGRAGSYLHDGRLFNLGLHGFAMWMPWEVADSSRPDRLTLRLRDRPETRAAYPFSFMVTLLFSIERAGFSCVFSCTNTGKSPMPYYAGFHPYFRTPAPGAGKELVKVACRAQRRMLYNPKLNDIVGSLPPPAMPVAATSESLNDMLLDVADWMSADILFPDQSGILMDVESGKKTQLFRYIQFYTLPDKPFLCVEPWMSHPNSLNTATGSRWLEPGETDHARITLMVTKLQPTSPP